MKLHIYLEADLVPSSEDLTRMGLENQRFRYRIDGSTMEPKGWSMPVALIEVPDASGLDWKQGESVTVRLTPEEVDQVPSLDGDRWVLFGLASENLHLRSIDPKNLLEHAKAGNYGFKVLESYLSL